MALQTFDFEKPIVELETAIQTLTDKPAETEELEAEKSRQLAELEAQKNALQQEIYGNLTPWNRVQIARHMERPRSQDFIDRLITDWHEIKGDRYFHDDAAVICGLGRFEGEPVAVIGQQKGHDTRENVVRNFGMMHPEGYRKALRLMTIAERFNLPILILIDTPGAYPGIGAEERGQSEAIARNIMEMFMVRTPMIGVIIGEGASGGALGVGVVDRMFMLENSWYCVISPEGCASILWRNAAKAPESAEVLKLTGEDLKRFEIVERVIPEPLGGAHRDPHQAIENLRQPLIETLAELKGKEMETLLAERFNKFRRVGVIIEE
jgi:acetyl-CoA carboxylase carboxyl transferase subunit alpha